MEVKINGGTLAASREDGDKPIYRESTLWYHIKKVLNAQGHRFVRQVPSKDGHLTSAPYYLKPGRGSKDKIMIADDYYAIFNPAEEYRKYGFVNFSIYPYE